MGSPLTLRTAARTAASRIGTGRYTEGFAAILAEHAPVPMLAPVEVRRPARVRREPPSDDARHLPALKAAALGWILLLSTGAASWYAIVDPIWSIPITLPSQVRTLSLIPPSAPSLWANGGETLLIEAERAIAVADEWVFETIEPNLPKSSGTSVETAALSMPATIQPTQTTHRPAADLPTSFAETTPIASTSSHRSPKDMTDVPPGTDPERPDTSRNGEAKETIGNPFIASFREEPQNGWPNITTASRAGTGASQIKDPQPGSSSKGSLVSHADLQDPHPVGGTPSESKGKKESRSDKPSLDGRSTSGGKGPKAGKDKPLAGKSGLAGPQDNRNSNRSGPSSGKADQDDKSGIDKKGKDKSAKDSGKGGKDKGDRAKSKGPTK